ncbi:uncharacterized protein LOC116617335 [Nematostella vectensis]|uniref:uncharacterized protein LOC116617335 n=1 Tax=Nematostella vectensis TaxID=45351 RepID=UPI00207771EE|nr:uncharacterized protein LOC116617335 [Nematostella vectensis]
MMIVCAGVWKTGTKSLTKALRILGYRVYDLDEQFQCFMSEWESLIYRDKTPDFKRMFRNVDAVVDAPSSAFLETVLVDFPDALVILTTREADDWSKSMDRHLEEMESSWLHRLGFLSRTQRRIKPLLDACYTALLGTLPASAGSAIRRVRFQRHAEHVKAVVPSERLLVFDVKEGWGALCDFLGTKPPRDEPFPHVNKDDDALHTFQSETQLGKEITSEISRAVLWIVAILVIVLATLFGCLRA